MAQTVVLMKFGSHLYGTDTPQSDLDYKGVFLPDAAQVLLGRIPKSNRPISPTKRSGEKNAAGDLEIEMFSIHEFMRLALEGQTMALDMLHASPSAIVSSSGFWTALSANRHRFHTKNLKSFVGYARRQAAKYGVKGSRLATARWAVEYLRSMGDLSVSSALSGILSARMEHVHQTEDPIAPIAILGKAMTAGAKCSHYLPAFEGYLRDYGARAVQAESNQGVDWKAMSHAVRAAVSVEKILRREEFSLPFDPDTASHLLRIKMGMVPFRDVSAELEDRIDRLERLAEESDLPDHPDHAWADQFLLAAAGYSVLNSRTIPLTFH